MEQVKPNSIKAWLLAARPKTLSGAAVPVLLGSALAYADGSFNWIPALICLVFASLMQIAANFINDLYDYIKGTDRDDRLGPLRACAQKWITPRAMRLGIVVVVSLAIITGCSLILFGGWKLIYIGAACILFAFFYTTGPYPLSYKGWGDLLVIIFFGFVPVCGTYFVQTLTLSTDTIIASLICGFSVDTLLVINNYRDRDADAKSGKKTVIVRFGEAFGRYFYLVLGILSAILSLWFIPIGGAPIAIIAACYTVLHIQTWRQMCTIYQGKELNIILGKTSRNMLFLGVFLSLAICF